MADGNSTQAKTCVYCDAEFASTIAKAKYCCDAHQRAHYRKTKTYGPFICINCMSTFYRRDGRRDAFCSRSCSFDHRARMKCVIDGHRRMATKASAWARAVASAERREAALARLCRCCGKQYRNADSWSLFCSVDCRDEHARVRRSKWKASAPGKASRRSIKAKRRAAKSRSGADMIDPIRVFERDKWRCHICGTKTPAILRGTTDDRAPELEHIVSLADGGTHTWGNVACSCRRCNQSKGAASFGQLGLGFSA